MFLNKATFLNKEKIIQMKESNIFSNLPKILFLSRESCAKGNGYFLKQCCSLTSHLFVK